MGKYVVKTGESLTLYLNVDDDSIGFISEVATVSASLKKAAGNGTVPAPGTPAAAHFTVTETLSGWEFVLPATATATLAPAMYVMDAKMRLVSGDTRITDPVQIEVRGSVS